MQIFALYNVYYVFIKRALIYKTYKDRKTHSINICYLLMHSIMHLMGLIQNSNHILYCNLDLPFHGMKL